MANDSPQQQSQMQARAHRAYFRTFSDFSSQTTLLFSVRDGRWEAWYKFTEMSVAIAKMEEDDLLNNRKDKWLKLVGGSRAGSTCFNPSEPMRVDEISNTR